MSVEENKALVRRWFEDAYTNGDLSVVDEVLSPDSVIVQNDLKASEGIETPEDNKKKITMFRDAFPDVRWTVDKIVGEGDLVAVAVTFTGTHKRELWGCPPTGKKGRTTLHLFIRFAEGKIVEVSHPSGVGRYNYALVSGQLHKEQEEAQSN